MVMVQGAQYRIMKLQHSEMSHNLHHISFPFSFTHLLTPLCVAPPVETIFEMLYVLINTKHLTVTVEEVFAYKHLNLTPQKIVRIIL